MGVDFSAVNANCEGCRYSKPGRKSDCDVKRALLLPGSARAEFVEWARGVYRNGWDCKYRERASAL